MSKDRVTLRFVRAFCFTMQFEGEEYVDHPSDRGGPTKFGLTIPFLLTAGYRVHPRDLTMLQAMDIYYEAIWAPIHFDTFRDDRVAIKTFDIVVHRGRKGGIRVLQRALNDALVGVEPSLVVDGHLGPVTRARVNHPWLNSDKMLYTLVDVQRVAYQKIVANDPSQAVFFNGWMKRAAAIPS